MPISDFVIVFEQLPRNTSGEVFAAINDDLDTAMSLIDASFTDKGYVTRDFVTAVRARAALYSGDSATALTATQNLINNYTLADQGQYFNMFRDDTRITQKLFLSFIELMEIMTKELVVYGTLLELVEHLLKCQTGFYNAVTANAGDIRFPVNVDPASDPGNNLHHDW